MNAFEFGKLVARGIAQKTAEEYRPTSPAVQKAMDRWKAQHPGSTFQTARPRDDNPGNPWSGLPPATPAPASPPMSPPAPPRPPAPPTPVPPTATTPPPTPPARRSPRRGHPRPSAPTTPLNPSPAPSPADFNPGTSAPPGNAAPNLKPRTIGQSIDAGLNTAATAGDNALQWLGSTTGL